MTPSPDPAGLAALSICEALLLALSERKLLPSHEIVGLLSDAAATLEAAHRLEPDLVDHAEAAKLITKLIEDKTLSRSR